MSKRSPACCAVLREGKRLVGKVGTGEVSGASKKLLQEGACWRGDVLRWNRTKPQKPPCRWAAAPGGTRGLGGTIAVPLSLTPRPSFSFKRTSGCCTLFSRVSGKWSATGWSLSPCQSRLSGLQWCRIPHLGSYFSLYTTCLSFLP